MFLLSLPRSQRLEEGGGGAARGTKGKVRTSAPSPLRPPQESEVPKGPSCPSLSAITPPSVFIPQTLEDRDVWSETLLRLTTPRLVIVRHFIYGINFFIFKGNTRMYVPNQNTPVMHFNVGCFLLFLNDGKQCGPRWASLRRIYSIVCIFNEYEIYSFLWLSGRKGGETQNQDPVPLSSSTEAPRCIQCTFTCPINAPDVN